MIIFLDFETTGLIPMDEQPDGRKFFPNYRRLDAYNNARAVQLAFCIYHNDGRLVSLHNHIIKPNDFAIPSESTAIHKITHMDAMNSGKDINIVLDNFEYFLDKSSLIVGHNINFDRNILLSEAYRHKKYKLIDKIFNTKYFCTMKGKGIKKYVGLPSQYYNGYKNPKLIELHNKLFMDRIPADKWHNALTDAKITAKCFFALKKLKIIK